MWHLAKVFPTVAFGIQVFWMRLIILRLSPGFWLFWKFWGETTRHFSTLRKRVRGSDRRSYATEKHGRSQFRGSIMGGAGSPGSPFLFQGQAPRGSFWSKTWQQKSGHESWSISGCAPHLSDPEWQPSPTPNFRQAVFSLSTIRSLWSEAAWPAVIEKTSTISPSSAVKGQISLWTTTFCG